MVDLVVALAEIDCERLRPGWWAQPANAASSFAYVTVGGWLLWRAGRNGAGRGGLVAAGLAMAAAGIGSITYHGPQPGWAGTAHDAGVYALALVIVGQHIRVLSRPATRRLALGAWKAAGPWLGPGLAAYVAGRSGSSLCRPSAVWQFHAAWHVLSAVGLGVLVVGCSARGRAHATGLAPHRRDLGDPPVRVRRYGRM